MGIFSKPPSETAEPKRRRPAAGLAAAAMLALLLAACGSVDPESAGYAGRPHAGAYPQAGPSAGDAASAAARYDVVGTASWYGKPYHGRRTASGEVYNMHRLTAAHRTLPFGTRVVVTNLENGRTVIVTINDRGPFKGNRVIDVSQKAAGQLGFLNQGLTRVGMRILASSQG
jgi:rare lipoprotein A